MTIRSPFGGNVENTKQVTTAKQFGTAVDGVITLEDNATYLINGTIDLQGDRLVCGQNTSIFGYGSENCWLKSTGLTDDYLITSQYSLQLNFVTLSATKCLNLVAIDSTQALDWFRVNITDTPEVGLIKDYGNFVGNTLGFLNSDNLTFDGTFGTIAFTDTIFIGTGSGASIVLPSTLTVIRRFRVTYSSFIAFGSQIGIDYDNATIPAQALILDTCNFSGGATYLNGVSYVDNVTLFVNCVGIENSREASQYYMKGNATATVINTQGLAVKILGTTTSLPITSKFTNTDNRATYTGSFTKTFHCIATTSLTSGNAKTIGIYIAKNGTIIDESESYETTDTNGRLTNITVQAIVELSTNDYIEIFVENDSDTTNITVRDLNVTVL